jgi:energy-coupling factor transporter ATP-binding protein EcfA2
MTKWGLQPMESFALVDYARQLYCHVCDGGNRFDSEFCRHCRAPLALTYQADGRKRPLHLIAVLGAPGCGKSVFLGMLTDILSRRQATLQILARGAFSVSLQQQSLSSLACRQFPPPTPQDPEGWNWMHCEVSGANRKRRLEIVMPDISGEAFVQELEHNRSVPVIRAFLGKCTGAILLVDSEAAERGDQNQDFLAMKFASYLLELNTDRKKGWPVRPVAVVFTKTDESDACCDDPTEFARTRTPGLWRHCQERLQRHRFFAATVVGACAQLDFGEERVSIPLRIEPRGVVEPFLWLVEHYGK